MSLLNINDKECELFSDDNYVMDYDDHKQWCQRCVFYGSFKNYNYNLCCENFAEISIVSFCGHCKKFSDTKKINPLKRWFLTMEGFEFKNKAR